MTTLIAAANCATEAGIAAGAGADLILLTGFPTGSSSKGPSAATPDNIRSAAAALAGRRPLLAWAASAAEPTQTRDMVEALLAAGADRVAVPLFTEPEAESLAELLFDTGSLARLVPVLLVTSGFKSGILVPLARAGFSAILLDTGGEGPGRLLDLIDVPTLAIVVEDARALGLRIWLAGGLEAPDVMRLLPLRPDGLVFDTALRSGHAGNGIFDVEMLHGIRALMAGSPAGPDTPSVRAIGSSDEPIRPRGASDRVFIRDFILPVRIGVYEHEKAAAQRVSFDVEVEVTEPAADLGGMRRIFSYDLITDSIRSIVAGGHLDFVETLAERIAARILVHPRADRVRVRVEKLEIGPGGVGVEIVRERAGRTSP